MSISNVKSNDDWRSLRDLACKVSPIHVGEGFGIVTTGCEKYMPFLTRLIVSAKKFSSLQVEVAYRSGELTEQSIKRLNDLGTRPIDMTEKFTETVSFRGYALKPYAILSSNFRNILFLDADNQVLGDLEPLFQHEAYVSTGAVFWTDTPHAAHLANKIHKLRRYLGVDKAFTPIEAGQMLVDRTRHTRALHATAVLNAHASMVYPLSKGDKDTFPIGFDLTQSQYSLNPFPPSRRTFRSGGSLIHYDFHGKPIFHHSAGGRFKWCHPVVTSNLQDSAPSRKHTLPKSDNRRRR